MTSSVGIHSGVDGGRGHGSLGIPDSREREPQEAGVVAREAKESSIGHRQSCKRVRGPPLLLLRSPICRVREAGSAQHLEGAGVPRDAGLEGPVAAPDAAVALLPRVLIAGQKQQRWDSGYVALIACSNTGYVQTALTFMVVKTNDDDGRDADAAANDEDGGGGGGGGGEGDDADDDEDEEEKEEEDADDDMVTVVMMMMTMVVMMMHQKKQAS